MVMKLFYIIQSKYLLQINNDAKQYSAPCTLFTVKQRDFH